MKQLFWTRISFPDSVRYTGDSNNNGMSLNNYDALEYIKFPAGIETHPATYVLDPLLDVVTGKQVLAASIPSVARCDKLNKIIIPEGIKVLLNFKDCKALKSIILF